MINLFVDKKHKYVKNLKFEEVINTKFVRNMLLSLDNTIKFIVIEGEKNGKFI